MTPLRDIAIRVVEADGLSWSADVLVLKHAQALYGLDALVVDRAGIDPDVLPPPDGYRVFRQPRGVNARTLLFVGVRSIQEFSYPDVRRFGYKALCSVASAVPDALEVAVTLHGVGYGLDELECFDAELAGLHDALESGDFPRSLQTITFLEINPGRSERLTLHLDQLPDTGSATPARRGEPPEVTRLREAGREGTEREHAFVAMPFDDSFSDLFHYGISSAVRDCGLLCERIDQQAFTGDVLERLKDKIRTARLVVADLTGDNPNVFLEVGYAWGADVPTVLVCREGSSLKFDVQGQKCIFYSSIRDLETKLTTELHGLAPSS